MIHESLIKRLRTESLYKEKATIEIMDLCMAAADALEANAKYTNQLCGAIDKLKQERDEQKKTIDRMNTEIKEAIRARDALMRRYRTPKKPHPDGDTSIEACPTCGSGEYLYNDDGNDNRYCGQCGQRIDWTDEEE